MLLTPPPIIAFITALLPLRPLLLGSIRPKTADDGADDDVALFVPVAKLTAGHTARDRAYQPCSQSLHGGAKCVADLLLPASAMAARAGAGIRSVITVVVAIVFVVAATRMAAAGGDFADVVGRAAIRRDGAGAIWRIVIVCAGAIAVPVTCILRTGGL